MSPTGNVFLPATTPSYSASERITGIIKEPICACSLSLPILHTRRRLLLFRCLYRRVARVHGRSSVGGESQWKRSVLCSGGPKKSTPLISGAVRMPFGERPGHIYTDREVSRLLYEVETLFGRVVEVEHLARVGVYL